MIRKVSLKLFATSTFVAIVTSLHSRRRPLAVTWSKYVDGPVVRSFSRFAVGVGCSGSTISVRYIDLDQEISRVWLSISSTLAVPLRGLYKYEA